MLITGASKGVGKTTAVRFAMAGCSKIALVARSSLAEVEKEVKAAAMNAGHPEPHVLSLNVDVTLEDQVRDAASTVGQAFGGSLDVLIANAGYLDGWKLITESDSAPWWTTWEVNVKGTYLFAKYFIPLVLQSSLKTFMTLSSIGAQWIHPSASSYQTAKFAICRFTEFIDQEYHTQGLIAVAVHPGGVRTELATNMPEDLHKYLVDTPEVAADAMLWLAKERKEWLAGRFFSCNWDVKELEERKDEIVEQGLLKFRMRI
ncbi:NAD(P)-binding protein [Canariomyces notabilis]|uniref:NAD(P)-binding protein n=1 Tax=Canariomyces notabilis TaxID=2074819 RepID=A0AAN6T8K3_9PEZI|nr:NAD(P)-binding protein [Canariomyces arenarius]